MNTSTELISVIVTCFNRKSTILDCLNSIKNQTYANFECIVVDDGSTDGSANLIADFAKQDPRFKPILSEHVGFPLAKNLGLDNVKGAYIIFLDSDDTAYPYWLEFLYRAAKICNAPISTCYPDKYTDKKSAEPDRNKLLAKGLPIAEYSSLKMTLLYFKPCLSFMWNKLIKSDLYSGIRHKDQYVMSDVSVMYKIFDKAEKVAQVKLPLVHYHEHAKNMTAESQKKDVVKYFQCRFSVDAEMSLFIYRKYPQTRAIIKRCLFDDINWAKRTLGEEKFNKVIDLTPFKEILQDNALLIIL